MKSWLAALAVIILALGGYFLWTERSQAPTTDGGLPYADELILDAPNPGPGISSPFTLTGQALGSWYFEASFPVELLDRQGTVLAQGPAQAQGDWMSQDFVPFSITLTFAKQPVGSAGTLVLKNDNPSGDPARDKRVEVPIVFQ